MKTKIKYLKGRKSFIHLEAPHAAQGSSEEFLGMVDRILKTSEQVEKGICFANNRGMQLLWQNDAGEAELGGIRFIRFEEDTMFLCHPEDESAIMKIIIEYLEQTFDFGTGPLAEDLNIELGCPALLDNLHRYVGGDLNRSIGTINIFTGDDNSEKWTEWNANEADIIKNAKEGVHVVFGLHSMDPRDHRRFINDENGEVEYDREIIIGSRFGKSADPKVVQAFYLALQHALNRHFDKKPRVKIDLEFVGDLVLSERRDMHAEKGLDVNYVQIEFMKYLLEGENYQRILAAMKEALAELDSNLPELPVIAVDDYEFDEWFAAVVADKMDFYVEHEKVFGEHEPFIRLSAIQRDYLNVDLGDLILDSEGRSWFVRAQRMDIARLYTEQRKITIAGADQDQITLFRKSD